ncbi:MAG: hypothetical protein F6K54_06065 [Okeania sp. SIO3B5]|uniref:hypothetical protein n=1 Tax=Okeania sp. SIO3B5 TaxID=2607811 RepID=UPI0013FFC538|nr:hypothetical protein [Okeania sp. SIO3B5]NEO52679.1 hypothetical protein [Okeania sp. SIO3B5]
MKLPEKPKIPDSKDTIFWLKFQSQIVNQKNSRENIPPERYEKIAVLLWLWLVNLMCVDPKELHGTSYVSKELDKATLVTASVTTIANWWNAFTTLPFLLFMFESMGIFSFPAAMLSNVVLIKLGNSLATGVASHQPGSSGFALIGTGGFITLNIVLTFISGVGSELLLNQPGLSRKLGEDLAQESVFQPLENEISVIQQNATKIRQECTTLQRKLEALTPNDPKRDELHLAAYGLYADRINQGGYKSYENDPIEQWPACPKANALEAASDRQLKVAQDKYQEKLTEVKNYGSDLAYLKNNEPEIYESSFNEAGNISSGTEVTRVAAILFVQKLLNRQWVDLGQSLFVMTISVITSTIAIFMAISYSRREDVQMSKSEAVIKAREVFINETIFDLSKNQVSPEDERLFALFVKDLKETGHCDYPPFFEYVKHAREMEKTRYLQGDVEIIEKALEQVKNGYHKLINSNSEPEIVAGQNLINQGCDSITALASRYYPKSDRVKELIKTVEYVQAYLQYPRLNLPLTSRTVGYLEELLTASISLVERMDQTMRKNYDYTIKNI